MQDAQFQVTQQDVEQSIADFSAAARDVRAFFFAFLSITAYIAVIVAGTTDLQLVRVDPVTLPLVNVEVPILGFYVLVPPLLLVLHVHLLLQFHHLARRQHVVQREIDALRRSIGPDDAAALYRRFIIFPLVQWLRPAAGRQLRERFAYGAIGWLTLVFFPLFLLVWIQLRILCVHDEAISWVHRVVTFADTIAIWVFVPAALRMERQRRRRSGNGNWRARWGIWQQTRPRALREAWWGLKDLVVAVVLMSILGLAALVAEALSWPTRAKAIEPLRKFKAATRQEPIAPKRRAPRERRPIWLFWVANLSALLFALVIGTFPHERLERALVNALDTNRLTRSWVTMSAPEADQVATDIAVNGIVQSIISQPFLPYVWSQWIAGTNPRDFGTRDGADALFRHIHDGLPVNFDFPYRHLRITSALLGQPDGGIRLYRAFRLNGAELVAGNPDAETLNLIRDGSAEERKEAMRKVHGFDLRGRNLTYALLEAALLPKAKLNGACLDAARLEGALLDGAQLGVWEPRSMKNSEEPVTCGRRPPSATSLNGANLREAELRGADLSRATLRKADLRGADLERANLSAAELHKADLRYARLRVARLAHAKLPRADLARAILPGANLVGATLPEADLTAAKLPRANLNAADLRGADLYEAQLQGAILHSANLQGAYLREAELQGTGLGGTQLQGANFNWAPMLGANLSGAELAGASLYHTDLRGADLRDTQLQGADLGYARLHGSDFRGARIQGADFGDAELRYTDLRCTGSLDLPDCWGYRNFGFHAADLRDTETSSLTASLINGLLQGLTKRSAVQEAGAELDERLRTWVEERLRDREGKRGSWQDAEIKDKLLCDEPDSGKGCISDTEAFNTGRAELLAETVCSLEAPRTELAYFVAAWEQDAPNRLARKIIDQLSTYERIDDRRPYIRKGNVYYYDDGNLTSFGKPLMTREDVDVRPPLKRLLAPDCAGAQSLSDEVRSNIRRRIAELDAKFGAAPEPATNADPPAATPAGPSASDGAPE